MKGSNGFFHWISWIYIYISKNRDDLVIVTVSGITCTVETAYIPQNKTCFDDWWNLCNNRLGCWRSSKVLWFLNSFPSISGLEASLRWYSATFSSKLIDVAVSRSWSRRASKKSAYSPTRSFSWSCLVGDFCTDSMVNPVNHHEKPAFGEYEKKIQGPYISKSENLDEILPRKDEDFSKHLTQNPSFPRVFVVSPGRQDVLQPSRCAHETFGVRQLVKWTEEFELWLSPPLWDRKMKWMIFRFWSCIYIYIYIIFW